MNGIVEFIKNDSSKKSKFNCKGVIFLRDCKIVNSTIPLLLVLQDRDMRLDSIERALSVIPSEIKELEDKIKEEEVELKKFSDKVKELEASRAALRTIRLGVEDKIVKYKTQLLSIKKNDEYQAMLTQIDTSNKEVSDSEEKELEILFEIDISKQELEVQKLNTAKNIEEINSEIKTLNERQAEVNSQLEDARFARREAEKNLAPIFLEAYEKLCRSKKSKPILVPLEEGRCAGCHLKNSMDKEERALVSETPVFCEHCGRMIYS